MKTRRSASNISMHPSVFVEPGPTLSLLAEVPIIRLNGIKKAYIDSKLSVNYHFRHSPHVALN